ncbi:MAG TPA: amidohydrolase family protein [Bacillota bacterium]
MKTFVRAQGIIDGTGRGYAAGHGLLLEEDRILAAGPEAEWSGQADQVVDLSDTVLIPGFVDAHSHITIRPWEGDQHGQLQGPAVWQALRGVANLRRDLCSGVTTMRVMAEEFDIDVHFKAAVARGDVPGPRLRIAGRGLSPTHGHGASLQGVDGSDALRRAVRENLRRGADHIKIFATGGVSSTDTAVDTCNYTREEIRAVVDEAHRNGRKVAAHAHGGLGVDWCAEEGVDSIEHGALLTPENVERMRRHGTWLVVTQTILFHPHGIEGGDGNRPAIMEKVRAARGRAEASFALALEAGIRFAVGTDSMHGHFADELDWLVAHGVSPEAALVAGTRHGAEVMGIDHDIGTLQPGRRADFVALLGNPLEDFGSIHRVAVVFQDGRLVVDRDGRVHPKGN